MASERVERILSALKHIMYNDLDFYMDKVVSQIIRPVDLINHDWFWKGDYMNNSLWPYVMYKGGPFKKAQRVGVRQMNYFNEYQTLDERYLVMDCTANHSGICVSPHHISVGPLGPYRKTTTHNGVAYFNKDKVLSPQMTIDLKYDISIGMPLAEVAHKYGISHANYISRVS